MKTFITLFILFIISSCSQISEKKTEVFQNTEQIFQVVEENPEFPGGLEALRHFFQKNIQYPASAKEAGAHGKVFLNFVVEKDGSLTDIKLLKGLGFGCDEEALRVMQLMPKWNPGKQSGEAVRVKYNLPIQFSLE